MRSSTQRGRNFPSRAALLGQKDRRIGLLSGRQVSDSHKPRQQTHGSDRIQGRSEDLGSRREAGLERTQSAAGGAPRSPGVSSRVSSVASGDGWARGARWEVNGEPRQQRPLQRLWHGLT